LSLQLIITFEEYDGKTKMTLQHVDIPSDTMKDATEQYWNESFDKLAASLE